MSRASKTLMVPLLAALTGSGCTMLGPDYTRPDAPVASDWLESEDPRVSTSPPVDTQWWSGAFRDVELDRLIQIALEQNLSLQSAGLRVLQSQQQLAIAIGNQYPQQQQLTGSASRQKEEAVIFNEYSLGFNVSWEIDFWGRFRRQVESASATLDASVASYDAVLVSLVSQVAQTYILIRATQQRIQVARNNIALQEESFRIAKAKFDAGEVSELDVNQADTLLNNTRATVYSLQISLQQLKNSLATLLGKPPQELQYLLAETEGEIPETEPGIAVGMPQDLIRRRPDVRVAERQLAAQSAQIGFAITELYPHLSIGGAIGTAAMSSDDLFKNETETWSLFGLFEWNLFNYGRLESSVRLQDAAFQQLLADYRNTVLQAQADVENAIVAFLQSYDQLVSYRLAEEASQRAVNVSQTQYQNGLIDFNTVINTLSAHLQQQDVLKSAEGSVATNLVQVYRALGGGWGIREDRDPVDFIPADTKEQMRERTRAWEGHLQ